MSAIAGIYNLNSEPIDMEQGKTVMRALRKYPADDVQAWQHRNLFLGCHAQWITPESVHEPLPYYDSLRQLAITSDAIIDNRQELFDRLQVEHGRRNMMPDSQLILLAYDKWGEEAPKYLVGDFAFMIWDERKRLLFGARDFSGSRTLYYYLDNERLAFCTTIEPLFVLPYIEKRLNEQWLAEYLANPGVVETIDPTSTVYKKIAQLPPSHTLTICNGTISVTRYMSIVKGEQLKLKNNKEYEEAFREVFQTAVTSRLRTYKKVGSFLSGGLDSGSIVSFAARALRTRGEQLYTYSYVPANGFQDWTPRSRIADERPFIQSTVQYVGNIKDHYLDFDGKSPLSEVDEWIDTLEMPYKFFENSFWLKGVYEKAHEHNIGVLLNGARGNYTISWGSALDYYATLFKRFHWFRLIHEINMYSKNKGINRKRIISMIGKRVFPLLNRSTLVQNNQFPSLINPEFAKRTEVLSKLREQGIDPTGNGAYNFSDERMKRFSKVYSWAMSGTTGTRLSLRYSLWGRDPTNDIRVIRFCLSVPECQFVQNGMDRSLIRRSTEGYLPDKVRLNQRVRGIQGADGIYRMAPVWSSFIEEIDQLSMDPLTSEFINTDIIKTAIEKFRYKPVPENVYDFDFKILMRSLIVHRFLNKLA